MFGCDMKDCKFDPSNCPLGSSLDLCFKEFKQRLNNDSFTIDELEQISTVCKWREKYYMKPNDYDILMSAYKYGVSVAESNRCLSGKNQVILYALAEKMLSEIFPNTYVMSNNENIINFVPWFNVNSATVPWILVDSKKIISGR